MRKFVISLGVAALAVSALTSCNGNKSNASAEDQAFADTLATTLGQYAAAEQVANIQRMKAMMSEEDAAKFSKEDFLLGLRTILESDTSKTSYYQGIQVGLQLMQPIIGISQNYDIPVDPETVYKAFAEVYKKDSIADAQTYYVAYREAFQKLQQRAQEIERKRIEESKENIENVARGKEFADSLVKAGYTRSESGLVYKIENPGTEAKVQPTDKISIYYTGRNTEGNIFDQTQEGKPYTSFANVFVPGFNEALSLVGKGGKITVAIPGDLAYGLEGAGEAIGPNETLVFDIEVVDVTPADNAAKATLN